jgi:hypothetical protein
VTARPQRPGTPATTTAKSGSAAERTRRSRDASSVVGPATREAIDTALGAYAAGAIGSLELRVLLVIVQLLTSWSRTADRVGTRQIAATVYQRDETLTTGWQRRNIARALRQLHVVGALDYAPGIGAGSRPCIQLGRGVEPTPLPVPSKGGQSDSPSQSEEGPSESRRGVIGATKGGPDRGHSENSSENSSEKNQLPARANAKNARAPDALFEAVVAELGVDPSELTRPARGALNKALQHLREVGADPAEVSARAAVYRAKFHDAPLTGPALAKHWAELRRSANNLTGNYRVLAEVMEDRKRRPR